VDPWIKQIPAGLSIIASSNNMERAAELLFARKLHTKISDIVSRQYEENLEVRDKDNENKAKSKWYTDEKQQTQ